MARQHDHLVRILSAQGPTPLQERFAGRNPFELPRRFREPFDPAGLEQSQRLAGFRPLLHRGRPMPALERVSPVDRVVVAGVLQRIWNLREHCLHLGNQNRAASGAPAQQVSHDAAYPLCRQQALGKILQLVE